MSLVKLPERWSDAAPSVVPILRGITAPVNLWRAAQEPGRQPVTFPFAPGLHLLVALDQPGFRVFLTERHLQRWNVSADVLRLTALSNLDPSPRLLAREDGIYQLEAPDGNASARLALPHFLHAFSERLGEPALAAIPTGRTLLVGGRAQASRLYAEAEARFRSDGEAISPCLYNDQGVDQGAPHFAANAERYLHGRLYQELGQRLEDEDRTLATYKIVRRLKDGICVSYCDFATGILLPVTDVVMLPGSVPVPFARLQSTAGWVEEVDLTMPCIKVDPGIPGDVVEGWKR